MTQLLLIFISLFLLLAALGSLLFYREDFGSRLTSAIDPERPKSGLMGRIRETGFSLTGVVESFRSLLPRSEAEVSVVIVRMRRARFRNDSAVNLFYGFKVLIPLTLCLVAAATGLGSLSPFFAYAVALGLGFLAPDFWLGHQIRKRQDRMRRGLPDVLDMLVICIEAGLSLDHAILRTSEELYAAHPDLCDELGTVVLEQRAGKARDEAWKGLAERTDLDCVKNLAVMVIQSEQLGTSVARTLRVHSDTMRVQRVQELEEKAAKTTVKLIFPLVLCIFPALFLVMIGPAILSVIRTLHGYFGN